MWRATTVTQAPWTLAICRRGTVVIKQSEIAPFWVEDRTVMTATFAPWTTVLPTAFAGFPQIRRVVNTMKPVTTKIRVPSIDAILVRCSVSARGYNRFR